MTNVNPFGMKNNLAALSNTLQPLKLNANTLATHLSPHGLGKQALAASPWSLS